MAKEKIDPKEVADNFLKRARVINDLKVEELSNRLIAVDGIGREAAMLAHHDGVPFQEAKKTVLSLHKQAEILQKKEEKERQSKDCYVLYN